MHVMVDIETLDTLPTAVVLSIGAVEFQPETGEFGRTAYVNVSARSCQSLGLTISADTVMWWLRKSVEARAALCVDEASLPVALLAFSDFMPADCEGVWSYGPSFDEVVLQNAYRACGLKAPWRYRAVRCCRTIYNLAGIRLEDFQSGEAHNALDDARSQAAAVIASYRKIYLIGLSA